MYARQMEAIHRNEERSTVESLTANHLSQHGCVTVLEECGDIVQVSCGKMPETGQSVTLCGTANLYTYWWYNFRLSIRGALGMSHPAPTHPGTRVIDTLVACCTLSLIHN